MTALDDNMVMLREWIEDGLDPSQPTVIDFIHSFHNADDANSFAKAAISIGYEAIAYEPVDEEGIWEVVASCIITPTCDAVTAVEEDLEALALDFDGDSEGWHLPEV
jgi:regulator of RNase E activity RraB